MRRGFLFVSLFNSPHTLGVDITLLPCEVPPTWVSFQFSLVEHTCMFFFFPAQVCLNTPKMYHYFASSPMSTGKSQHAPGHINPLSPKCKTTPKQQTPGLGLRKAKCWPPFGYISFVEGTLLVRWLQIWKPEKQSPFF